MEISGIYAEERKHPRLRPRKFLSNFGHLARSIRGSGNSIPICFDDDIRN